MGIWDFIFGHQGREDIQQALNQGAAIVDVRTPVEFRSGHIQGSKNIPLQDLHQNLKDLREMPSPLVLCCATGARSGSAQRLLKAKDIACINGGSWKKVKSMMEAGKIS